mgnify:CR=1 FL=1
MIWGDRVTDSNKFMGVEPRATFLFQQEEGLENLVAQRRRWINGTVAGYFWLMTNLHLLFQSKRIDAITSIFTTILCCFQLLLYFLVALAPVVFFLPLRHLFLDYIGIRLADSLLSTAMFLEITWWLCIALYLVFVVRHAAFVKYDGWSFFILGILGGISPLPQFHHFDRLSAL